MKTEYIVPAVIDDDSRLGGVRSNGKVKLLSGYHFEGNRIMTNDTGRHDFRNTYQPVIFSVIEKIFIKT